MYVAIYAWRVQTGKEEQFRKAWCTGTRAITEKYGSLGSRLHQDASGRFIGMAEWPDEASWRKAFDAKMHYDDPPTRAAFLDALVPGSESGELIASMEVLDDLLTRSDPA